MFLDCSHLYLMSFLRGAVQSRAHRSTKSHQGSSLASRFNPSLLGKNFGLVLVRIHYVGKHRRRDEEVFLAHDQVGGVEAGELETVAVGDGIGGAGLDTIAAEDAAVVVDIVDLGVTLGTGDALFRGVLGGFDVDAVRRAGGGA